MAKKKKEKEVTVESLLSKLKKIEDRGSKEARELRRQLRAAGHSLRDSAVKVEKKSKKKKKVVKEEEEEEEE